MRILSILLLVGCVMALIACAMAQDIGHKSGNCPRVRDKCTILDLYLYLPPIGCTDDSSCQGAEMCCFDKCLSRSTCKNPETNDECAQLSPPGRWINFTEISTPCPDGTITTDISRAGGICCQEKNVNGEWSEWSPDSTCSVNCQQSRSRRCDNPSNGGRPCSGQSTSTQRCTGGNCRPVVPNPVPANVCTDDSRCPGTQKCCSGECLSISTCKNPQTPDPPCSAEQPCPCDDGEGQYTEDDKCDRMAVCLDGTDEKNCTGNLPYYPSSYFQEDTFLYGRNDATYPPSTEEEKKEALAFVRQLTYTPQESPISTQTQYFQGDILLRNPEELDALLPIPQLGRSRVKRHHLVRRVAPYEKKWPGGRITQIPYAISNSTAKGFSEEEKELILGAIGVINATISCLNFVDRVVGSNDYYVHILNVKDKGCASSVGYGYHNQLNTEAQDLFLEKRCLFNNETQGWFIGTAIHELMHAAGFWHEQSRSDQEKHIKINEQNIKTMPSDFTHNFRPLRNLPHLLLPYDFNSLMHYSVKEFSKDDVSPTIEAINNTIMIRGERGSMKPLDVLGLKLLYGCGDDSYPQVDGCKDLDDPDNLCEYWARPNKTGCKEFPDYMNAACKKTCDMCQGTKATGTKATGTTHEDILGSVVLDLRIKILQSVLRVPSSRTVPLTTGHTIRWTEPKSACIRGHNNKIENDVTDLEKCKQLCLQEYTGFTCRSIMYSDSTKQCTLSEEDRSTITNFVQEPCSIDWIYTEPFLPYVAAGGGR